MRCSKGVGWLKTAATFLIQGSPGHSCCTDMAKNGIGHYLPEDRCRLCSLDRGRVFLRVPIEPYAAARSDYARR